MSLKYRVREGSSPDDLILVLEHVVYSVFIQHVIRLDSPHGGIVQVASRVANGMFCTI